MAKKAKKKIQGQTVPGTGLCYTEPPVLQKAGHVPSSLPTEKQGDKLETKALPGKRNIKCCWAGL